MASESETKPKISTAELLTLPDETQTLGIAESVENALDSDEILNSLKTLLSTLEKLQKVRLEAGDIKLVIEQMLDGEIVRGEEIEKAKTAASTLNRLVRAYSDHQAALFKSQPARTLLDLVLNSNPAN
ncbi:hypothetical protein ACWATR_36650 [Nostoc sp. UIC 10890]